MHKGHSRYLKVNPEVNDGVGHNRWVYCRFCGALNDTNRRTVGDGEGNVIYDIPSFGGEPAEYLPNYDVNINLSLVGLNTVMHMLRADWDGSPIPVTSHDEKLSVAESGCFFCGSRNYY